MSFFNINKKKAETPKETQRRVDELEKNIQELSGDMKVFKEFMKSAVTNVGIVRFNTFHETGSDQSFSVALLDQRSSGVVISSHFFKEYNRVYAKPVKNGISEYALSDEEKEAIAQAIKFEARNPKSETISNDQNPKSKTT